MAEFSGNIIEAYYTNPEHNSIEIIFKKGEKAFNYHMNVNYDHPDFKEFIKEYSLEKVQQSTNQRLKNYKENVEKAIENYRNSEYVSKTQIEKTKKKITDSLIDFLINFNENSKDHMDLLFTLKLKVFDLEKIKTSKNEDAKSKIRKSVNPYEVISELNKL